MPLCKFIATLQENHKVNDFEMLLWPIPNVQIRSKTENTVILTSFAVGRSRHSLSKSGRCARGILRSPTRKIQRTTSERFRLDRSSAEKRRLGQGDRYTVQNTMLQASDTSRKRLQRTRVRESCDSRALAHYNHDVTLMTPPKVFSFVHRNTFFGCVSGLWAMC